VPETPPLFTSYSLPLPRRRQAPAAALSFVAHAAIAILMLWRGAALLQGGGGGTGPRGGGGGGGGRPAVTWFTLPAASAPRALDVPAPPAVTVPTVALPDPVKIDVTPPLSPPPLQAIASPPPTTAAVAGSGTGTTGGPGQGPGSGGGQGTGTGPGSGSDAGPGSGGEAGYILPATPRWAIFPPPGAPGAVRGHAHQVRFWVTADGRVTRVEVTPPIKDAAYRRQFNERMMGYLFTPAATRDGRRVDYVASVTVIP